MYGTFSKSTAEQLARAAQENVAGNAEGTQNSTDSDMPTANTNSPQHQAMNHASSLAGNINFSILYKNFKPSKLQALATVHVYMHFFF